MKLSEALSFKKSSLQVEGFVDLGEYSKEKDQDKLGDHALVIFLFQSFCGKWFQTIGAFLGVGAVPGITLEKNYNRGNKNACKLRYPCGLYYYKWCYLEPQYVETFWYRSEIFQLYTSIRF